MKVDDGTPVPVATIENTSCYYYNMDKTLHNTQEYICTTTKNTYMQIYLLFEFKNQCIATVIL